MRGDWMDILFEDTATCGIGGTNIQIVRDSTIHGNLVQEQKYIRAIPIGPGFACGMNPTLPAGLPPLGFAFCRK